MSIFKTNHWWSSDYLQDRTAVQGVQNGGCMKVDKFNVHSDSDCIIIGEDSLLRIYKPNSDEDASHLLLEMQLASSVLQIDTGKFTMNAEDHQLLVLHPHSYAIYGLERKEGHTEAGEQNNLHLLVNHTFMRKAHSLTCGPFGNTKTRDLICIQALDGSLNIFDQDSFLFICLISDVIIPGPITYIASSDTFVLSKTTWVMEIYTYQQLKDFSELNVRQNKKNTPQWAFKAGEEIFGVQAIQTSNNFSSIIAMGERCMYCFQDNGLMKFMKKFDYMPICFYAYLIGWYYEPGARMLVMVASDDSKLYIYENTTLLWSCDLPHVPIAISRCFLKYLPGGIVTLSVEGVVKVTYLGTEPDLNPAATPVMGQPDPKQVQDELDVAEECLQKIMDHKQDIWEKETNIESIIKIKADVGQPKRKVDQFGFNNDENATQPAIVCPVVVIITCEEPKQIQAVQITYVCRLPFECYDSTICLDGINGTEIIETNVFVKNDFVVSETRVEMFFTITDHEGRIEVITRSVMLPLMLYCVPSAAVLESQLQFEIGTNHSCVDLFDLFTDFTKEELTSYGGSPENISFAYRTNTKHVTVTTAERKYYIQCDDYTELIPVLDFLTFKLMEHFARMGIDSFQMNIKIDKDIKLHIMHKFIKCIEAHANERIEKKRLEDELETLQRQFTIIQKRLLVQYGSAPPGDCDSLEFLMRDTNERLTRVVEQIIKSKEDVCRAGSAVASIAQLMLYIFKITTTDYFKVKLIDEMMSLNSLYEDNQDWEEAVTQAMTYIINNVFNKSEKDKEKLAPVTEQGILSHINLKRFLKQIRIILDKMFSEGMENEREDAEKGFKKENKMVRIEEFVEVI